MLLVGAASAALLVRLTVRDQLPVLDIVYYAFPLVMVALVMAIAALLLLSAGRRLMAGLSLAGASGLAAFWVYGVSGGGAGSPGTVDLRLQLWNVARGRAGWEAIADTLRSGRFDVLGLVEAGDDLQFWRTVFPDAAVETPGGGLVLVVRGAIERSSLEKFGARSVIGTFDVVTRVGPLRAHLVDVQALLSRRQPLMQRLTEVALAPSVAPVVVMGDFNTPLDSIWLRELRETFANAHEAASSTLLPTWPSPFPILSIDQIWVDRRLSVTSARRHLSWLSDHARLDVQLSNRGSSSEGWKSW